MATRLYTNGLYQLLKNGTDNYTGLKIMLVDAGYTFDPDHAVVDPGTNNAADLSHNEIAATNYAGGHGGAGRKAATLALSVDNTNNRVKISSGVSSLTWTSLGGATNDTVAAAVLIKPGTSDDTTAVPVIYLDGADITSNGQDLIVTFPDPIIGGNV